VIAMIGQLDVTTAPPVPGFVRPPRATRALRFHLAAQADRAVAFTLAAVTAAIARALGFLHFSYPVALPLLGAAYSSVLLFDALYRRAVSHGTVDQDVIARLAPWWIFLDVGFVTVMVGLTGGNHSAWWVWYIACAGSAALMGGRRLVAAVALASSLAYIGTLAAAHEVALFDERLFHAAARMLFLYSASAVVLMSTAKLRDSHRAVKALRAAAAQRAQELEELGADLAQANHALEELTLRDPLTGLHNRRFFSNVVMPRHRSELNPGADRRTAQSGTGLLLVDIDHFKRVNDQHGHPAGDRVIQSAAAILQRCVRADDVVVRWGGEEFLVVLPGTSEFRVSAVAERIRAAFHAEPVALATGEHLEITCSIGWSMLALGHGADAGGAWDVCITLADHALYAAKRDGRNRVRRAHPGRLNELLAIADAVPHEAIG
jgi:diguanylate cyclase (GGDEF)-like protein